MDSLLNTIKQNDHLGIRLVSPGFGHLSSDEISQYGYTHRRAYYFLLFMVDGCTQHLVDLQQFDINTNELLFVFKERLVHFCSSKNKQ